MHNAIYKAPLVRWDLILLEHDFGYVRVLEKTLKICPKGNSSRSGE